MRCPKCHYLSFEPEARCRNCGYDLAVVGVDDAHDDDTSHTEPPPSSVPDDPVEPELQLRVDEPEGPMTDLSLRDPAPPKRHRAPGTLGPMRRSRVSAAGARAAAALEALEAGSRDSAGSLESEPTVVTGQDLDDPITVESEPVRQLRAESPADRTATDAHTPEGPADVDDDDDDGDDDDGGGLAAEADEAARRIRLVPPALEDAVPRARPARPSASVPARAASLPTREVRPASTQAEAGRSGAVHARRIAPPTTSELPLFVKGMPGPETESAPDGPLIAVPAEPRAPLSVQRRATDAATAASSAPRSRKPGQFDKDLLEDLRRIEKIERGEAFSHARASGRVRLSDAASSVARLQALLVDMSVLGVIGGVVLWLTLKWCGLTLSQVTTLPATPMSAFLMLLVLGYLLMFTAAGGQTPGKMLANIRVVAATDEFSAVGDDRLSVRQAMLRSLYAVPSVLAAGLGFIPALVGGGRALHDRLSGTRVVRE